MVAQTYTPRTVFGGGVVMSPAHATYLNEVAHCNALGLLPGLTNLGQQGDPRHQLEGTNSDHNAFVQGPSGLWYLRASDFGGPRDTWNLLIEHINWRYGLRDERWYPYGYTNSDEAPPHGLTVWFGHGETRQGTDGAHAHGSSSRANTNTIGRAAWNPAMERRDSHFLEQFLRARLGGNIPAPADQVEDDMYGDTDRARDVKAAADAANAKQNAEAGLIATRIARDSALEAKRLMQVQSRIRPPKPGDQLLPLPAGVSEPVWLREPVVGVRYPAGTRFWSENGLWNLTVQGDGNVVLYALDGGGRWASKTSGAGAYLVLQPDGNLAVYLPGKPTWSTRTNSAKRLVVQDDGNVVLRDAKGGTPWNTGPHA
jgi:hypothetical protein